MYVWFNILPRDDVWIGYTERRLHRIEYGYFILSDCTVKLSIFTKEDYCIVNLIMIEIIFIIYNVRFPQSSFVFIFWQDNILYGHKMTAHYFHLKLIAN